MVCGFEHADEVVFVFMQLSAALRECLDFLNALGDHLTF